MGDRSARETPRCQQPGCARFVTFGADYCRRHDGSTAEERHEGREAFARRLDTGDYHQLYDERWRRVITTAASEHGLQAEIGILRVVLAQLLLEEHDANKLVAGVTRLVGAMVQASRAEQARGDDAATIIHNEIDSLLREHDGG